MISKLYCKVWSTDKQQWQHLGIFFRNEKDFIYKYDTLIVICLLKATTEAENQDFQAIVGTYMTR